MTHYAWTIRERGRCDIQRVTTLAEMQGNLRMLELPGTAPPNWVIGDVSTDDIPEHGHYTHNEGGKDEWSLTWTKVDW